MQLSCLICLGLDSLSDTYTALRAQSSMCTISGHSGCANIRKGAWFDESDLSHGEKSISWTPLWLNRASLSNSGPPHRATPCLWKVARYVPRGDHLTYVSVQV